VPFCERVCPYCDFAVVAARPLAADVEHRYVAALAREIATRAPRFPGPVETLYFGGGTPSLLRPESIAALVEAVTDALPARLREVTLETNPGTAERERLPAFRQAGVDRLSIGVQSFDDSVLKRLGRAHRAAECHATLEAARAAGYDNVSLDLIFAAPGQDEASLARDLDAVAFHAPEHVSAYELTVEEGTPFATAQARGRLRRPDEDTALRMFARVEERLASAGLERYEISSHARPGRAAVHNRRYWQRRPVLGVGMGAWSSEPPGPGAPHGARSGNPRSLAGYLEAVERGGGAGGEREVLSPATARGEAVFLALRQVEGLSAAGFAAEFGGPPRRFFEVEIDRALAAGWLRESEAGDLALTRSGRMLSDTVLAAFV